MDKARSLIRCLRTNTCDPFLQEKKGPGTMLGQAGWSDMTCLVHGRPVDLTGAR